MRLKPMTAGEIRNMIKDIPDDRQLLMLKDNRFAVEFCDIDVTATVDTQGNTVNHIDFPLTTNPDFDFTKCGDYMLCMVRVESVD